MYYQVYRQLTFCSHPAVRPARPGRDRTMPMPNDAELYTNVHACSAKRTFCLRRSAPHASASGVKQ